MTEIVQTYLRRGTGAATLYLALPVSFHIRGNIDRSPLVETTRMMANFHRTRSRILPARPRANECEKAAALEAGWVSR
jgi:hypothetical protein